MPDYLIGINGSYHDAAVCVLRLDRDEPELLLSEDRHSGIPHHYGFPFASLAIAADHVADGNVLSVAYSRDKSIFIDPYPTYFSDIIDARCDVDLRSVIRDALIQAEVEYPSLAALKLRLNRLIDRMNDDVADPLALRKRISYLAIRYVNELGTERAIRRFFPTAPIHPVRHHLAHAATYYPGPFENAAIITWDGRGEFDTTVLWRGTGSDIECVSEVHHPYSLGDFYAQFSAHAGFDKISGPSKLMGLAAYGDDRFVALFHELIQVDDNAFSFRFNDTYLHCSPHESVVPTAALTKCIGPPGERSANPGPVPAAIARAAQLAIEEACIKLAARALEIVGSRNLVVSGGLSLNCVMNERLRERLDVDPYLFPACGDDGTAIGAALCLKSSILNGERHAPECIVTYTRTHGTAGHIADIRFDLENRGFAFETAEPERVAGLLARDLIVGHMTGAYEFGPRALGFRSILADPRPQENWPRINTRVKFREDFRPFAPVMLEEDAIKFWGERTRPCTSPYMLLAPTMSERAAAALGAVIHVDRSARLQTLSKKCNPALYRILVEFKKLTGIGVLLNTSLNMSGESIIADHDDLLAFFSMSDLDAVVIEGLLIEKSANRTALSYVARSAGGNRSGYLKRRRSRYRNLLKANGFDVPYWDYARFHDFLFGDSSRIC